MTPESGVINDSISEYYNETEDEFSATHISLCICKSQNKYANTARISPLGKVELYQGSMAEWTDVDEILPGDVVRYVVKHSTLYRQPAIVLGDTYKRLVPVWHEADKCIKRVYPHNLQVLKI